MHLLRGTRESLLLKLHALWRFYGLRDRTFIITINSKYDRYQCSCFISL